MAMNPSYPVCIPDDGSGGANCAFPEHLTGMAEIFQGGYGAIYCPVGGYKCEDVMACNYMGSFPCVYAGATGDCPTEEPPTEPPTTAEYVLFMADYQCQGTENNMGPASLELCSLYCEISSQCNGYLDYSDDGLCYIVTAATCATQSAWVGSAGLYTPQGIYAKSSGYAVEP